MVPCGPCRSLDPPCPRSDTPIVPLCRLSSGRPKSNQALLDLLPLCIGGNLCNDIAQIESISALDGWPRLRKKCLCILDCLLCMGSGWYWDLHSRGLSERQPCASFLIFVSR